MTGLLSTCGCEFQDWSAPYRLFSRERIPVTDRFAAVRRAVVAQLPPQAPLRVAVDDSLLRKTGTRIPGVAWRRDPLSPRFQANFVRAQRVLQFSACVPLCNGACRMVPISFRHAPTPAKPSRKASPAELQQYRQAARRKRLPRRAAEQIADLRRALHAEPNGKARWLELFVDNGYTNETVLKKLPARTTLIGRIRKDAKLYCVPEGVISARGRGRPRHYGAPAPTPEQLRTDASVPWRELEISINGAPHRMRVKCSQPLLWRTAGLAHRLQLVVVAPLGYRLRQRSKLLYRQPAFLICTDVGLEVRSLVQGYVQRWDIEVNFRDEKTLLGVGEAQVRHPQSIEAVPALQVASYAMLLLASLRTVDGSANHDVLPPPKWISPQSPPRFSTQRAINQLRADVWGRALGLANFSDFATQFNRSEKPKKFTPNLASAVLHAIK